MQCPILGSMIFKLALKVDYITPIPKTHAQSDKPLFTGQQRTWMDRFGTTPGMSGRSTSKIIVCDLSIKTQHNPNKLQFLRLNQPVDESLLPIPRIAEKGKKYTFPFTFVIPERLLDSSCTHQVKNDTVREAHLQLPPSAGDPCLPGESGCLTNDLFPDMTRISYYIQVKMLRRRGSDNKLITLVDSSRKVRVTPNVEEGPPVHAEDHPGDYVLRAEKNIKKGIFKGKLGRLTVEAEQPKDLGLSPCPISTLVPISLWFVVSDESFEPPKLGALTAKLRISTFFSTSTINYIPKPSSQANDALLGHYGVSLLLSSRCMEGVKWSKQPSLGPTTYKATLLVPITVPKCKELVPSFTTCLISRSYILDLSVTVQASAHSRPSLLLKIPLRVSRPSKSTPSSSAAIAANGSVDEFFTPRSIAPPSRSEQGRPSLPGYSVLASIG